MFFYGSIAASGFPSGSGVKKVKVKVPQSWPTLWDLIDYSPWNSPGQNTGVGGISFLQGIFPTQGSNQDSHIAGGFFTSWATMAASSEEPICSAEAAGNMGSIPGLGSSPGGWRGNPLQYSCLGKLITRGAWWATIHGVAKSWTRLKGHAYYAHT